MGLLRRALKLLDGIAEAGSHRHTEWLPLRIRLLVSLAYSEAEFGTVTDGLERLASVQPYLAELPDGPVRTELLGFVNHNHGTLLGRAGRDEDGLPMLDAAIEYRQQLVDEVSEHGEDSEVIARRTEALVASVSNRGLHYVIIGRLSEARRDLNLAGRLAAEHDFRQKAAYVEHTLGDLERRAGHLPQALYHYDRTERAYLELGPGMLPRLRIDQAQALLTGGLADEAGRYLDEILPQMRRDRISQDLAEAELFRAAAALMEDDFSLAQQLAASAQRRMRRRGTEGWATVAALLLIRVRAARAIAGKRIPGALLTQATELADRLSELRLVEDAALARMLAVRLEIRRGRLEQARRMLDQVPRPKPHTPLEHRMLQRLCGAELWAAVGNRRKAFAQARAGLAELGRARDRMGGLELVSATSIHGQHLGDLAVRLVLEGGDSAAEARRMFDWLERTRAQTYRYEPVSGIDDPQLVELMAEIRNLGYSLRQAMLDGRPTAKLRSRYAGRQRAAMRLGWHASSRWGKPRPVATVAEVGAHLGSKALVSFAVSGDSLLAVVLVTGQVRLIRLGSAAEAIENARRLHADLNAMAPDHLPEPLFEAISASARKHAAALDEQLMRPLSALTGGLVIVPTGALYAVPWGALDSLRSRPITVAPSATTWLAATRSASDTGHIALVRGPGLAAAVGEIDKLAAHHENATLLAGDDATVARVLQTLDGAKLVHIAAHGEHEAENALFSKLELVDGALFAHELARLRHPAKQVVLAACELALNRIRPGDEALGFAGALLAGGVNTVIAAASRVGDLPSAAAMDDYHRALASGAAPDVALAEAVAIDPLRRPFVCLGS
jgi:tetratricopeptide (TPR) repeat protein